MSPLNPEVLLATLDTVIDPHLGQGLNQAGCVKAIYPGVKPRIEIELGFPAAGISAALAATAVEAIRAAHGIEAEVQVSWLIQPQTAQRNVAPHAEIKNIIAVASGKGGVGKSTVAANLALALQAEGARVGLLDADIYGPSQPTMMGVPRIKPTLVDARTMRPVMAHGIQLMSIGFLIAEDQPMIWRGPMATQALNQLLNETAWDALDYLVIDLPPGTGDIQLSIAQKMPVAGAVIVTTPQDVALIDAKKGLQMFNKVGVPVLGIVENMAVYCCPNCGHGAHIFGEGGAAKLAESSGAEVLGSLPLLLSIREQADGGTPTVAAEPGSEVSARYRAIARLAAARLAHGLQGDAFPAIEIA
ncbi:MAG: iron-sulfur cluster carrier protein ApbC [Pseudomonadota bacterium]